MRHLPLILILQLSCSDYKFTPEPTVDEGETAEPPIDTAPPETEATPQTDSWDLDEDAGIDVLFFGDTSGSMAIELTELGSQVTTFVEQLANYTDQWQLLAVTGPSGCGVNGVLTPETSDYATLFANGITTPPGEDEVDEWGLYNSLQAISKSASGGCNEGFLRDDARIHIIFISDEDDHSPGWDKGDKNYWQTYTDAIVAAKGDANQVVFSGVIGPLPDGCDGAVAGTGYAESIEAYGGELLSICKAWYDEIDVLVDASIAWPIFHLTETPVQATLQVYVNGEERTVWTYNGIDNTIVFTKEVPTIGDSVSVTYEVDE